MEEKRKDRRIKSDDNLITFMEMILIVTKTAFVMSVEGNCQVMREEVSEEKQEKKNPRLQRARRIWADGMLKMSIKMSAAMGHDKEGAAGARVGQDQLTGIGVFRGVGAKVGVKFETRAKEARALRGIGVGVGIV